MAKRDYYIKVGHMWHPVTRWNKETGLPEEVSPVGFTEAEARARECDFTMTGSYKPSDDIQPFLDILKEK